MADAGQNPGEPLSWRAYLDTVFPGYLLSSTEVRAIDPETAARFFRRLGGLARHVELLKQSSLIAARVSQLEEFTRLLGALARALPSRTQVGHRVWEGRFQGRLDVARTTAQRMSGRPTRVVTRSRKRSFDLPENQLVREVVGILLDMIASLHKARLLDPKRWGGAVLRCRHELGRILHKTVLSEVPRAFPISGYHVQAARAARHPCYEHAFQWHGWIESATKRDDHRLARILAEGALRPFSEATQFEIAVVTRLVQSIWSACEARPEKWTFQRSIILERRDDIACFERDDGARIRVYYNQVKLPLNGDLGPRAVGHRHYFENPGSLRPDITVLVERPATPLRGVVMEIKLSKKSKESEKLDYVRRGYEEALLYRYEYSRDLTGWPKAVLICSPDIPGAVSPEHEVVAVDWRRWVPPAVAEALLPPAL